jgi:hypothetical protein
MAGKKFLMSPNNKILFGDFVAMAEWVRMQLNKKQENQV